MKKRMSDKMLDKGKEYGIIRDIVTIYSRNMYKTQLYLPDEAREELDAISKKTSLSKSELVRRAVAEFTSKYSKRKLTKAFGVWKNHEINVRGLRDEWNR